MNRRVWSMLLVPFVVFVLTLLLPTPAAACNCGTACKGTYCWCACDFCSDQWPPQNPCNMETLAFNASTSELSAFKERIDAWSTRPHFLAVTEAARDLYDSVVSQDSLRYIEANAKFSEALSLLPSGALRELTDKKH